MANFGSNDGHGTGGVHNPFSMPNAMNASSDRHGSAEQDGAEPTYLDSMNGMTPPRTRVPSRTASPRGFRARTRARSANQAREEDDDYNDRRAERQESRREESSPVGIGFRINSCEQSIRMHQDELVAQRLAIQQMTDAITKINADKEITGQ